MAGTFGDITSTHLLLDATYNANDVTIEVTGFVLPGDFDLDGDVDLDDYDILSGNMYTATAGGASDCDFDNDGDVDFEDFVIQALHFGDWPDAEESLDVVPEPGAAWVLCATGFSRRRVNRSAGVTSGGGR